MIIITNMQSYMHYSGQGYRRIQSCKSWLHGQSKQVKVYHSHTLYNYCISV